MYVCLFIYLLVVLTLILARGVIFVCALPLNLTSPIVSFVCLTVLLVKSVINFDQEIR